MIIDGHAYCFPARDKAAGYPSVDERWHELQRELSGHHQPVWRVRDRAPADNSTLIDPETSEFHDVEFTVHRNRFTWDHQGETYTKKLSQNGKSPLATEPQECARKLQQSDVVRRLFVVAYQNSTALGEPC